MNLLAFDTSTEQLAVAVCKGEALWALNAVGGAQAGANLLPAAQALLAQAGLAMQDLQAIAYGCGPGAFTGLRTSCAVVQGLALGLAIPVLPICSLLIVAEDAWVQMQTGAREEAVVPVQTLMQKPVHEPAREPAHVAVAMDARMGEVYAARWHRPAAGDDWTLVSAPALYAPSALLAAWEALPPLACLAGTAPAALRPALDGLPAALRLHQEQDRARALMRLARAAWRRGDALDAAQAQPIYLRDKVALTTQERSAARQAQAA